MYEWKGFDYLPEFVSLECKNNSNIKKLVKPQKKVDVVIDTDTYNEIDDQYALAYLIKSNDKLNLKAIYAAPFYNDKSEDANDGMLKSYNEINNILNLMDVKSQYEDVIFKGSTRFLNDESDLVKSDAALDLVNRAKKYTENNPLYIIAIGAITNIASAIQLDNSIIDNIVLIWLGGNAIHWPDNREFNLMQDVAAARIIFNSGVALVQLPCQGVVSAFTVSGPELTHHLSGKNKLCDYLIEATFKEAKKHSDYSTWSRALWDVTAVGWLLDDNFMEDYLISSPSPEYNYTYSFDNRRHLIKYVYQINRDALLEDLFIKLTK